MLTLCSLIYPTIFKFLDKCHLQVEVVIGRVGSGSGSGQMGRVSLTFWKKSGQTESARIGSIYILCFFRSLIDFDWIEGHLISDQVGSV
jgi:hypothetical protein